MQRLFTTFANGWPGFGLLIQRLVAFIGLFHQGVALFVPSRPAEPAFPAIAASILGLFILAGLWTPVTGALVAAIEMWNAVGGGADVWMSFTLAVLGGTLAMIGPGAWSIDARLFGRKHITS